MFDALVQGPSPAQLIADDFLVPTLVYAPQTPDLAGIAVQRGDYNETQLAERMNTPPLVGGIVEQKLKHPERRSTIIFATSVAHSVHIRDEFRRAGVLAEHIDGTTPADERDGILGRLATGEVEVVTNCAVLMEGFDCPNVDCVVLARPTKSRGLFLQMLGRGMRAAPGKKDVLILDHAGAHFEHGFADDPIEWTLSPDLKSKNRIQELRGTSAGMPKLTTCPECAAVRWEGRNCGMCGWRPRPKPEDFATAEGDLGRLNRDRSVERADPLYKMGFHGMLTHIAQERGYQPGWAAHKYREKFGSWPAARRALPIEPDGATRAWVRSRDIAYAKAKAKAAGS